MTKHQHDSQSSHPSTKGQEQGTGVYCYYSFPLISKNVIKNHYYGVWGKSASPTLVEN